MSVSQLFEAFTPVQSIILIINFLLFFQHVEFSALLKEEVCPLVIKLFSPNLKNIQVKDLGFLSKGIGIVLTDWIHFDQGRALVQSN